MKKQLTALILSLGVFACDSGSVTESTPREGNRCDVRLVGNDDGFEVKMTLSCIGADHTSCYTIEALTCGGKMQQLEAPISIASCPGDEGWCVDDCVGSLEGGNGQLWDTPELLARDACNTYNQP